MVLMAQETPAQRPPPPMGTITASSAGTWRASSRPRVALAERSRRTLEGMDQRAPLGLDGAHGLEGGVHVRHLHQLGTVAAHLGDAEGVRALHHHHPGGGADALCGEGHGNRVVAGADRGHAPRPRRLVEGERVEQRAPRLEGAGALEQLQLEEDRALRPERRRDGGCAPALHRRLLDQVAERRPRRLDRGEVGRGCAFLRHQGSTPRGSAAGAWR